MDFHLAPPIILDLDPRLEWLWYSSRTDSFIVGDSVRSVALPLSGPGRVVSLGSDGDSHIALPPYNLPIPASLYEEFANDDWRGFRFLSAAAFGHATGSSTGPAGDLLRTIVFGPDYGTYVLHAATGAVFSLRAGSIQLLQQSPAEGFTLLAQTRTRGRAALAFAAHPHERLIVYGDNYGDFFAQEYSANGFGKARRIDSRGRKASALEFIDSGRSLVMGGTGYLAVYTYSDGKFSKVHEITAAVRNFTLVPQKQTLVLNQGLHGVSLYQLGGDTVFTPCGAIKGEWAVDTLAVSRDLRAVAMLEKYQQWPASTRVHIAHRSE